MIINQNLHVVICLQCGCIFEDHSEITAESKNVTLGGNLFKCFFIAQQLRAGLITDGAQTTRKEKQDVCDVRYGAQKQKGTR